MNPLNPKKLLLTKWTAVKPVAKQKHYLVSRVIEPELPSDPIQHLLPLSGARLPVGLLGLDVSIASCKAAQVIAWRDLQDDKVWRQGWV